MKNKIIAKLLERGVKSSCRGFPVVVRCIEIALSLDYVLVTKNVYPVVAREINASTQVVEARFRRTLEKSGIEMSNLEFIMEFITVLNIDDSKSPA